MGVLNTTYTFLPTDVITSTKMNNIIDETTFTDDAIVSGNLSLEQVGGKLKVKSSGIGSNELASGAVTTTKITDLNVTTGKLADSAVTTAKIRLLLKSRLLMRLQTLLESISLSINYPRWKMLTCPLSIYSFQVCMFEKYLCQRGLCLQP
jgi:hypothetical protein